MPERKRVVIVDEEFPYPANSGKRLRTLNLVLRLAQQFDITYVAHINPDAKEYRTAIEALHKLGIKTTGIRRNVPPRSGIRFFFRLFASIFSRLPYSVTSHVSDEMRSHLQTVLEDNAVRLWHCEWTPYTELFRGIDANPLVIAAHNVESLIWKRYGDTESNFFKRWYIRRQLKKFERFERWAFQRATRTIMVSDEDARLSVESFGAVNVDVVENGVDTQQYQSTGAKRCPKTMIFVGSLDWRPNLDGIKHFLKTVYPAVLKAEPEAKLEIVGRHPAPRLVKLFEKYPNITLRANVADVIPYLSAAGIMIVPLRVGGGSRLKIIEAAANGLPVVSTRIGAEGLDLRSGEHYIVAGRVETLAEPIIHAMRNYDACLAMAERAREMVVAHYQWDALAEKQSRVWQSAMCDQQ